MSQKPEVDRNFLSSQDVEKATGIPSNVWDAWLQTGLEVEGAELYYDAEGKFVFALTPASAVGKPLALDIGLTQARLYLAGEVTPEKVIDYAARLFPGKTTLTTGEALYLMSLLKGSDPA